MGLISKLIGVVMAGTGGVLLLFGMDASTGIFSYVYFFVGLLMMSMGFAFITGGRKQQKDQKPPPPTVTEIRCDNSECTFKEIRDFEKGDYILKPVDAPCPKCGGSMTVEGIYIVREEPEQTVRI
ncbi:MAG: hypothetical protein ACW99U_12995 [Candidatus Thorarchaeota archaeon]|jgi:hypothetical protein